MGRYFLEIAYNGAKYHGWQVQPNAITVQEVVNDCLQKLIGDSEINVVGCGRTDTGVHASQFYLHFDTERDVREDLSFRLNRFFPEDIAAHKHWVAEPDWHARFSATRREYQYCIHQRKDPFKQGLSWSFGQELDLAAMNQAAQMLLGEHDFTSFSKAHTQTATNLCEVFHAEWEQTSEHSLKFTVAANRFLRNMVRALVGTLVEVGIGNRGVEEFGKLLIAGDRSEAGQSAPAHGLFLTEVAYPFELT